MCCPLLFRGGAQSACEVVRSCGKLCVRAWSRARYTGCVENFGIPGKASDNPFSPTFGVSPVELVGRDDLLTDIGSGWLTGPHDRRYYSVMMGQRGSGKTVTLTEMENHAEYDGWIVLSVDAATDGLLERINQAIFQATKTYEGLDSLDTRTATTATRKKGMILRGFEMGSSEADYTNLDMKRGLRGQLTELATLADSNDSSVLLTIDELQGIDRIEGRRLSNDLQHIRRDGLPLAFLGAGLSEAKNTILLDNKMSFFKRCEQYDMPSIGFPDAWVGIKAPIERANGSIADDALKVAAEAVDGLPYKLQLIGYNAWKLARAPENPIDIGSVLNAIDYADSIVDRDIGLLSFNDLSDTDKLCLASIAVLENNVTLADLIDVSGINFNSAKEALRRLSVTEYVTQHGDTYSLTNAVSTRVIYQQFGINPLNPLVSFKEHMIHVADFRPKGPTPLCNNWMKRAKAHCILNSGHAGGCRSK